MLNSCHSFNVRSFRLVFACAFLFSGLGENCVVVVDMFAGRVIHRITELNRPQGVLWVPTTARLYVANAGDGRVLVFDGVASAGWRQCRVQPHANTSANMEATAPAIDASPARAASGSDPDATSPGGAAVQRRGTSLWKKDSRARSLSSPPPLATPLSPTDAGSLGGIDFGAEADNLRYYNGLVFVG
jgi:hypothetical protein